MQETGLITLPGENHLVSLFDYTYLYFEGFLLFWGVVFIISTTLVALLKHETDEAYDLDEPHFGLAETYKILFKVLRLPCGSKHGRSATDCEGKTWY